MFPALMERLWPAFTGREATLALPQSGALQWFLLIMLLTISIKVFNDQIDVHNHVFDYDEEETDGHNYTELNNNSGANPNPNTKVNNNPNPDRSIRSSTSRMDQGPGRKPSGRGRSLE